MPFDTAHHQMATKIFWSLFDVVGVSDGDWLFLVTEKGGMSHVFGKPLMWAFKKRCHKLIFYDSWNFFSCHGYHRGGNIIFLSPSDTPPPFGWQLKLFSHPRRHGGVYFIFSKILLHPPPPPPRAFSRWLKNFSCHSTYPIIRWRPKRVGPMLLFWEKK